MLPFNGNTCILAKSARLSHERQSQTRARSYATQQKPFDGESESK